MKQKGALSETTIDSYIEKLENQMNSVTDVKKKLALC
jgi:hypothetical protein